MDRKTARLGAWLVLAACLASGPARAGEAGADAEPRQCHGIAMHGEPLYPADFAHFAYVNPDAPRGGTLGLGAFGGFDSFNTFILKGNPAGGLALLYDTLMTDCDDEAFTQYGLLAETIQVPADRSWALFSLRQEARWNDGKPVTADDVVFTFETLVSKGHPSYSFYYKSVKRCEKLDERRVKFSFATEEINRELPLIIGQLPVLPKHYWEGRDFAATTLEPPLGSGPYRIKSFEPNRYIVYERAPDYWAEKIPTRRGMFNFAEVRFDYFRDETVLLDQFKSGVYDFRMENNSKDWATAYNIPAVEKGWIRKEEIPNHYTNGMQGYVMNLRRPLFQDPRVRQALTLAFDFEWSNKTLFYGAYTRSRSYFNNSELEAKGLPEGEELSILQALDQEFPGSVPTEVFSDEYSSPSTGDWKDEREHRAALRRNLHKAMELLKQAGWSVRDGDKLLVHPEHKNDNGEAQPFAFEILLVSPAFERITLPYTQSLKTLGIDARVQTVDTARYQKRVQEFDYDMIVGNFGQSMSPGNEQRSFWSSAAADTQGSRNLLGIKNPAIDKAVDLIIQAPDRESLVMRTRALDRILQWGHYVVPHWYIACSRVASWDKFSRPAKPPRLGRVDVFTWWIDAEKARALAENCGR